jgi:hypothetical protein
VPAHLAAEIEGFPFDVAQRILRATIEIDEAADDLASRWAAAFMTGAREGELLGLQWDRVDWNGKRLIIRWQLQQLSKAHGCGDQLVDDEGKNGPLALRQGSARLVSRGALESAAGHPVSRAAPLARIDAAQDQGGHSCAAEDRPAGRHAARAPGRHRVTGQPAQSCVASQRRQVAGPKPRPRAVARADGQGQGAPGARGRNEWHAPGTAHRRDAACIKASTGT